MDDNGCARCGGTGFVITVDEHGVSKAAPCACRGLSRAELRRRSARIPDRYRHCTFESFALLNNPSLEHASRFARRVVDDFPGGDRGLLLTGPCGVGKTHLAVAALRALVEERGAWGHFVETAQLLRSLQDSFDRDSDIASREVLEPVMSCDVLLLDDLGVTRGTPWERDTLGLVINERYNKNGLTILTTNLPVDSSGEVEGLSDRLGERLASRLAEMCWTLTISGVDFRRNFRAAQFHR